MCPYRLMATGRRAVPACRRVVVVWITAAVPHQLLPLLVHQVLDGQDWLIACSSTKSGGSDMSFGWGDCEVVPRFLEWQWRGVGVPDQWGGTEGQIKWSQAGKFLEYHLELNIM